MSEPSALRASVLDVLPLPIALFATDGEVLLTNQAWKAFAHATGEAARIPHVDVGENYFGVCDKTPDSRSPHIDEVAAGIRAVLRGERANFGIEYRRRVNQELRWFRIHVAPLRTPPAGAAVTIEDISELRAFQSKLRSVLDSSQDLIYFKDRAGVYRGCNAAVGRLIGREPAEIVGRTDGDLFHEAKAKSKSAFDQEILSSGQPRRLKLWHHYPDGRSALFDTLKTPFFDADGELVGVLGISRDVTQAQRQQTLLTEVQAIIGLGAWELDLTSGCITWTDETYRIFGLEPDAAPSDEDDLYRLVHPDDRDAVMRDFDESLAGHRPHDITHRILRPDGEVRWVRQRARHVFDDNGNPFRSFGAVVDTTDEHRALEGLRNTEERYRALFERADDALWVLSDELGLNEPNPTTARLFGYDSVAAMAEMTPLDLSPPRQPDGRPSEAALHAFKASVRTHGSGRTEWEHQRRDGTRFMAEVQARKIPYGSHHVVLAQLRNLTEHRRRAERERLADAVFRGTAEGITITDADANIVTVNPAFTKITGYAADEVLGRNPRILQSGRHDRDFYLAMWDALTDPDRGYWQGELWNRRKDGELYAEWMSISAIRDSQGQLTNYVAAFDDITGVRKSAEEIERLSNRDPLTDLPNERRLRAELPQMLGDARTQDQPLAVFYLDIDHYKSLVVAHGHGTGDAMLQLLGKRLQALMDRNELLAKLSDDTFAIVAITEGGLADASALAARYLGSFSDPFRPTPDVSLTLTACIGVSLFPDDARDAPDLLRNAASALLQAKQTGPGQIAFYRPEITAAARKHLELETALRSAFAHDSFELHYQPVVDAASGIIVGAEALLRWRRVEELVAPGAFIEVIEGCDLIHPLGRWIIEQAVGQLADWQAAGLRPIFVSVNVAEAQITRGGLAELVASLLSAYRVPATLLHIEVLERVLLNDPSQAQDELSRVRALGCRVALDDFGTGYSSLAYLTQFKVDSLKIDRSFVSQLVQDPRAAAIIRATLPMARSLGITTVAEGVEHDAERQFLLEQGCDIIQGYLASRPLPAAAVTGLLQGFQPLIPRQAPDSRLERRLLLLVGHPESREALGQWAAEQGWQVYTPETFDAAIELIASQKITVALIEENGPDGPGISMAERLRHLYPRLVRIFAIKPNNAELLKDAVNRGGVFKVLIEPFEVVELRRTLDRAIDHARFLAKAP